MDLPKFSDTETNEPCQTENTETCLEDELDFDLDLPEFSDKETNEPCQTENTETCLEDPDEYYNIHGLVYDFCQTYSEEERIQLLL